MIVIPPEKLEPELEVEEEPTIPLYAVILIAIFSALLSALIVGVIVLLIRRKLEKEEPEVNTVYVEDSARDKN